MTVIANEAYLCAVLQVGKIEGLTGGDLDVVQDNVGAGLLAGLGASSGGEGASRGRTLNKLRHSRRSRGSRDGNGAESQHRQNRGTHFEANVRSTDK